MKNLIACIVFMLTTSAMATELTLGLGTCSRSGEWCSTPTGKLSIYHPIYSRAAVELGLSVDHYSRFGDGELKGRGDRGLEIIVLQVRIKNMTTVFNNLLRNK